MKKSSIFLLVLVLAVVLFPTVLAAPRRGGTAIIGVPGDYETLNPILSESDAERDVFQAIFSALYRTDNDMNYIPDLLAVMPAKKGLVYHYTLRSGVKFSDGHELTAEDVKFTWECFMNPKIAVPGRADWDKIKSLTIPTITYKGKDGKIYKMDDKYHFTVTLKDVFALYDTLWADVPIVPRHILVKEMAANGGTLEKDGSFSRNPIGSGPFTLKEWIADKYIMAVRNPSYIRAGQPYLDRLIWKIIPNANVMLSMLRTGEIDVCTGIQIDRYYEMAKIPGIKVFKIPTYTYNHIEINLRDPNDLSKPHPILSDKRVRQALDYAFPREMAVESVLENVGYAAYSNLPPFSWAFNKAVSTPHFDPEKAGRLLDEAGWRMGDDGYRYKDGNKLLLSFITNAGNKVREQVGAICQEYWQKIGVGLRVKYVDFVTLTQCLENSSFDLLMAAWVAGVDPNSYSLWHSKMIPTKENKMMGQNYVAYVNPEMDKLMVDGLKTDDQETRTKIYFRMQEILAEDVPYIFVNFYATVHGARETLGNYEPNPLTGLWNVYEWYLTR